MNPWSPGKKLEWAEYRLSQLKGEIERFFQGDDYQFQAKYMEPEEIVPYFADADLKPTFESGRWAIALSIKAEPPLDRWSLIIGEVVNGLRSCLDHSIYLMACANLGRQPEKFWELEFPILSNEEEYERKYARKLANIPSPACDIVKSAQPFQEADSLLLALRELSNTDKHRTLQVVVAFLRDVISWDAKTVGVTTAALGAGYTNIHGDKTVTKLVDGLVVSFVGFGPPKVNKRARVVIEARFDIIFDEGSTVSHGEVCDVLTDISNRVRELYNLFEPFFAA